MKRYRVAFRLAGEPWRANDTLPPISELDGDDITLGAIGFGLWSFVGAIGARAKSARHDVPSLLGS